VKVSYGEVGSRTLAMQVYDHDRFSADELIGQVAYPLASVDLTRVQLEWRDIQTPCSDEPVYSATRRCFCLSSEYNVNKLKTPDHWLWTCRQS